MEKRKNRGGMAMKSKTLILALLSLSLIMALPGYLLGQSNPPRKLKVYISADMEGVGGVVHADFTSIQRKEYPRSRRWMTQEVNAAIEGALAAGATEIVVNDSHGSMRNILIEELNPAAKLITGSPKALSMMEGIDSTFDAVIFIGYHARMGTERGILDHTYSSRTVSNIRINGRTLNEAEINAAIAGYYGVPVVMISGDEAVVRQTKEVLKDIEGVVVKRGVGRYAAEVLHPEKVRELIREGAKRAIANRKKVKIFKIDPPIKLEIEFLKSSMADMATLIPGVKRIGGRTVFYEGKDYIETFKLMRALIALARE